MILQCGVGESPMHLNLSNIVFSINFVLILSAVGTFSCGYNRAECLHCIEFAVKGCILLAGTWGCARKEQSADKRQVQKSRPRDARAPHTNPEQQEWAEQKPPVREPSKGSGGDHHHVLLAASKWTFFKTIPLSSPHNLQECEFVKTVMSCA